jgi:predicted RNA binding protein YcfA (HicA-like mRNA interferase family)
MSERAPRVDGAALVKALKAVGFVELRQRGSHLHLYRESDRRRTTVPMHGGRILPPKTLLGILNDADLTVDRLRQLL